MKERLELREHGTHAAGGEEILHVVLADRLQADQHRGRSAELVEALKRKLDAEPASDRDLREMLAVLGLDNLLSIPSVAPPDGVLELLAARERARAARDYAEADRLRDAIGALGWQVRDGPEGAELLPAS